VKGVLLVNLLVVLGAGFLQTFPLRAETGAQAWLRYARLDEQASRKYDNLPAAVVTLSDSAILGSSRQELIRGVRGMLGRTPRIETDLPQEGAFVLGTLQAVRQAIPNLQSPQHLRNDSFWLTACASEWIRLHHHYRRERPRRLYGVFSLLSRIARHEQVADIDELQQPGAPVVGSSSGTTSTAALSAGMLGGRSFLKVQRARRSDACRRVRRLLASVGINGCTINNVNADRV